MYQGRTLRCFFLLAPQLGGSSFTARLFSLSARHVLGAVRTGWALHESNPYGHFPEAAAAVFCPLNRDVQQQAFGFGDDFPTDTDMLRRYCDSAGEWPANLSIADSQRQTATQLIRTLIDSGPVSGFKDPRTLLNWPFWNSVLQDFAGLRVVPLFLIRSPHEIAMSLFQRARGHRCYNDTLDVVAVHFRRMKSILDQWQGDRAVLQFEPELIRPTGSRGGRVMRAAVGPNSFLTEVYDSGCRHHSPATVEHEAQSLFEHIGGQTGDANICLPETDNLRKLLTDAALREQTFGNRVAEMQQESARIQATDFRTHFKTCRLGLVQTIARMGRVSGDVVAKTTSASKA